MYEVKDSQFLIINFLTVDNILRLIQRVQDLIVGELAIEYLAALTQYHSHISPQSSLDKLKTKISDKLNSVINKLDNFDSDAFSLNFLKHRSFYDLLTHFKSTENDENIKSILNKMNSSMRFVGSEEFNDSMMLSMVNYKPVDNDLAITLKNNRDGAITRTQKTATSGSSPMSIGSIIVLVIIVIRLVLVMVRCSR